jgi:WD40 repeat protein
VARALTTLKMCRFVPFHACFSLLLVLLFASLIAPCRAGESSSRPEIVVRVGHSDWVASIAFSPDDSPAVSVSRDHTLKLWDVATGQLLRTFEGHGGKVTSSSFSPDGRTIRSSSVDETVRVWTVASGKLQGTFQGIAPIILATFSRDGGTVQSANNAARSISREPIVDPAVRDQIAKHAQTPQLFDFYRLANEAILGPN